MPSFMMAGQFSFTNNKGLKVRNLPLIITTVILTAIFVLCLYVVLEKALAICVVGLIFTSFAFGYIVRDDLN